MMNVLKQNEIRFWDGRVAVMLLDKRLWKTLATASNTFCLSFKYQHRIFPYFLISETEMHCCSRSQVELSLLQLGHLSKNWL
jgi:hypothetical protein